ncbi:MAG: hypothetical protein AB1659_13315, partial [Thermodesulfobacteriota bacterium]
DLYKRYPFPENPEEFKQKPEGLFTQAEVESVILRYGNKIKIPAGISKINHGISIGKFRFDPDHFARLILYVWEGGYPQWEKGVRPPYVLKMREALKKNKAPLSLHLKTANACRIQVNTR